MKTDLNQVLKTVCQHYDITSDLLFSRIRLKEIVFKKQLFMYLAMTETKSTLINLTKFIKSVSGQQYDHCTIMHSRNKIKNELEIYPDLKKEVEEIRFKISQSICDTKLIPNHIDLLQASINYTNSFI